MRYPQNVDKKQRTKTGHEIPVPKRKDFDAILGAVAKPAKKPLAPKRRTKK